LGTVGGLEAFGFPVAEGHAFNGVFEAVDDFTVAEGEGDGALAFGGVEDGAVVEGAPTVSEAKGQFSSNGECPDERLPCR
jgi:hypothetical protein